jgi:hypothetical protein
MQVSELNESININSQYSKTYVKYPTMSYKKNIFSCLQYEARYMETLVVTGTRARVKKLIDFNSHSSVS